MLWIANHARNKRIPSHLKMTPLIFLVSLTKEAFSHLPDHPFFSHPTQPQEMGMLISWMSLMRTSLASTCKLDHSIFLPLTSLSMCMKLRARHLYLLVSGVSSQE